MESISTFGRNIRKLVLEIQNDENSLLLQRKAANAKSIASMNILSVSMFVILFFLLIIVFLVIAYTFRNQLEFEKKYQGVER